MEPQFRFCTSADGARIAYATYGEGPRLLYSPLSLSMDSSFTIPESRAFFDALASCMTLATYDTLGTGASDRGVDEVSGHLLAQDLAAVADALNWQTFSLFANNAAILSVAPYAAAHPERVTRLIWWNTVYAGMIGADAGRENARAAHAGGADYANFRRRVVSHYFPDGPVRLQREYGKAWKATRSAAHAARLADWSAGRRVDHLLPPVATSALVLARSGRVDEKATVMRIAALLPRSELRFVPGNSGEPFPEHEPVVEAIAAFMGLDDRPPVTPAATAIILFTDIAGSTALTDRIGDTAFRAKARELDVELRRIITGAGGTTIDAKTLGDGVLATFPAASQGIAAALACRGAGNDRGLPLHLGLHAGDVIREADPGGQSNVYGGAVNIASRISGLSAPGEVLVSRTVRDLARTSAGVKFEDRGEHALKGIGEPQRVFAVRPAPL